MSGTNSKKQPHQYQNSRREFLATGAALVTATGSGAMAAGTHVAFDRGEYERILATGDPLMLDFYAPW